MQDYKQFIESKKRLVVESGFEVSLDSLNEKLYYYQKLIVQIALRKGRFALFEDCGLGKTFQQLEWAHQVSIKVGKPVLILAPLAVVAQTIQEAMDFDYSNVERLYPEKGYDSNSSKVYVLNYGQLKNVDVSGFCGVVLDESSMLKNKTGKTSESIMDAFKHFKYKLACSATPSPNDHMELGQHSEFLGGMSYDEMLAMFFVHDSGQTQKWRLRKYAKDDFWKYVCQWSLSLDDPQRIDENQSGYKLPEIEYIEHLIKVDNTSEMLFQDDTVSATDLHRDLKKTRAERIVKTAELINSSDESWIVWTLGNEEAKMLNKALDDSVNVQGSDSPEVKAKNLLGFAKLEFKTLITKTSMASFGLNYQHCHNMVFTSYDFKFEAFYQAVRRCYRFGQQEKVRVHLMIPESQKNVRRTILEKQKKHFEMIAEMAKYSSQADYSNLDKDTASVEIDTVKTDDYLLMNGDCVERIKELEDNSVDMVVFSPPFSDLYVYSDSPNDMGNVSNYEMFKQHFSYLVPELKRVLKKGRVCAVHCMDLPTLKSRDGYIGIRRFSAMIADMFEENNMFLHSEFTVWKDPLLAAVRTKTIGLAHKQLLKDSSIVRCGLPDKILCFKSKEDNEVPISKDCFSSYIPMHEYDNFPRTINGFNETWGFNPKSKYSRKEQYSHHVWQRYASPVWMDIKSTDVLKYSQARDNNDEKHICPLQLTVIERLVTLYSNRGETVLSPFGGIGSEGYQSLRIGRKSISIELKPSYFNVNVKNHKAAIDKKSQLQLF